MIPTTWPRLVVYLACTLAVGAAIQQCATDVASMGVSLAAAQAGAALVTLLSVYVCSATAARFLAARRGSFGSQRRARRAQRALATQPTRLVVYDHHHSAANGVGVMPGQSCVYMTSTLLEKLSDEALRGLIAHEEGHMRERHLLVKLAFSLALAGSTYAMGTRGNAVLMVGLVLFFLLSRVLEYRADAYAARKLVGVETMITTLEELARIAPPSRLERVLMFGSTHPTTPLRLRALRTGRRTYF